MRNIRAAGTIAMTLGVFGLFAAGAGAADAATTGANAHPECPAPPIVCPLPAPGHTVPAKPSDTVKVNPGKTGKIIVACAKPGQPPRVISTPGKTRPGAIPSDARTAPLPAKPVRGADITVTKVASSGVAPDGSQVAGTAITVTKLPRAGAVRAKPVDKGRGLVIICKIAKPAK